MKVEFFGHANEIFDEDELKEIEELVKDKEELIKELIEHIESSKHKKYLTAEIKILEEIWLDNHQVGEVFLKIYGKGDVCITFGVIDENGVNPYEETVIGEIEVV